MGRGRLLFIAPVLPAERGVGLALRAGMFLDAAAREHDVVLALAPVAGGPTRPTDFVRELCSSVQVLGLARSPDDLHARLVDPRPSDMLAMPRDLSRQLAPSGYHAVHVSRLYLAGLAEAWLDGGTTRPRCTLDLDDVESITRRRLAARARLTLGPRHPDVLLHEADAWKYDAMERRLLPRFDRVFVASDRDRDELARRLPSGRFDVAANAVHVPALGPPRPPGRPPTLLFVGNLSYGPNREAVRALVEDVVPRLGRPSRVLLVGAGPTSDVRALADRDGVSVHGDVADVAPFYLEADLAVMPLFAGGGTRIKVLEAFAHGLPVVATPIAAEGLDVVSGEHLLTESTADGLAAACVRALDDEALRARLVRAGRDLVARRHTYERVRDDLAASLVNRP